MPIYFSFDTFYLWPTKDLCRMQKTIRAKTDAFLICFLMLKYCKIISFALWAAKHSSIKTRQKYMGMSFSTFLLRGQTQFALATASMFGIGGGQSLDD